MFVLWLACEGEGGGEEWNQQGGRALRIASMGYDDDSTANALSPIGPRGARVRHRRERGFMPASIIRQICACERDAIISSTPERLSLPLTVSLKESTTRAPVDYDEQVTG